MLCVCVCVTFRQQSINDALRSSTLTRMTSGNGSGGGENGRILAHNFPQSVQTLPCLSHTTASMGLGASGM